MDTRTRYDAKLALILHRSAEVFAEKGYHRASVRDVSAATGVSLSGLYYYFRSKEELLLLIQTNAFETLLTRLEEALEATLAPRERLTRLVHNHVRFFVDNMAEMKVLSHEADALPADLSAPVRSLKRRYVALVGEVLAALAPETPAADLRVATFALFGQLNWIYTWYRPDQDPDAVGLADRLLGLYLQGFPAQVGPEASERGGVSTAAFVHAEARHQQD